MDYANILVSADLGEAALDRMRLAAGLARRFAATLTGAAAHPVPAPLLVRDVYDAVAQEQRNTAQVQTILEQAQALFRRAGTEGIGTDWRAGFADAVTHVIETARAADLVVLSRRGPATRIRDRSACRPGPSSWRPQAGPGGAAGLASLTGSRIVVAWRDGPAARRAVSAALPFLRAADRVHVATVGADAGPTVRTTWPATSRGTARTSPSITCKRRRMPARRSCGSPCGRMRI